MTAAGDWQGQGLLGTGDAASQRPLKLTNKQSGSVLRSLSGPDDVQVPRSLGTVRVSCAGMGLAALRLAHGLRSETCQMQSLEAWACWRTVKLNLASLAATVGC